MRFAIGIQVMATGVSLPRAYLRTELVSILILLGPVMIYMWCVSGLLVWALIPGLNYVSISKNNTILTLMSALARISDDCSMFYSYRSCMYISDIDRFVINLYPVGAGQFYRSR